MNALLAPRWGALALAAWLAA
ncbi:MAG: hypothetical protein QG643_676, partial [Pseudomonadota bacterium]|nr:hypothetical protein [Pseudomonadota bacterium]